jgi:lipoyl(octanoyl) transferase
VTDRTQRTVRWGYLGRVGYRDGVALQHRVRDDLRAKTGDEHLLLLEHDPVYTLGRNASDTDVLAPRHWLEAQGVTVEECDRGGQVTFHGPGQLVGYPVVDLNPDRRDIRRYVRDLQEVLLRTLADFGVDGRLREGKDFIGVWVEDRKIASIGVHLSHWITTHGFALNVHPDLTYFTRIVPCGLTDVRMTSIAAETGRTPPLSEVAERVALHFGEIYDRRMARLARAEIAPAAVSAPVPAESST